MSPIVATLCETIAAFLLKEQNKTLRDSDICSKSWLSQAWISACRNHTPTAELGTVSRKHPPLASELQ